jgi:hypothetical protein
MNTPIQLPLPLVARPLAEPATPRHLNFPLNTSISDAQLAEIQHHMSEHYRRRRDHGSAFTRYHGLRAS